MKVHGTEADRWGGWHWDKPAHGEHFRRCSFCGSVNPEDLALEPSWRAQWAGLKYGWPHKFYVDIPNRDPAALFYVGGQNFAPKTPGPVAWKDLTDEQIAILERDRVGVDAGQWYSFGTRPNHYGKFYTAHLADPEIAIDVKETIQRVSGIRFVFDNGGVKWHGIVQTVEEPFL